MDPEIHGRRAEQRPPSVAFRQVLHENRSAVGVCIDSWSLTQCELEVLAGQGGFPGCTSQSLIVTPAHQDDRGTAYG